MKKRTVGVLLGFFLTASALAGCGDNQATEAATESAVTEDEGAGDAEAPEEQQEREEKEQKKEAKAEKKEAKKAEKEEKDSGAETEKAREDSSKEEKDEDEASGTDEDSEDEDDAKKVAVLMPDEENWGDDAKEIADALTEDGYEPVVEYAEGDSSKQTAQIQELMEEPVEAFIITPADAYGLTDVLASVKEENIPVFSYDELIMNTNGVKYYTTFGGRELGRQIAEEIVDREELEKLQEEKESRTIEFLMGSLDNSRALFMYNGMMEVLQPYLDDGTLVCPSGKTSFDDTGILRWSGSLAGTRMEAILEKYYTDGEAPDIICTGFDEAALNVQDVLEEAGILPGSEEWPLITGAGCTAEAVKSMASGGIGFSIFTDYREQAKRCEDMVDVYLTGEEDPEVNDYEQYDNGVKIIGTYLCESQVIDQDNYELLIDNGYYTEEEVTPEQTPTPTPETTPTTEPTLTPEADETEDDEKELTAPEDEDENPEPTETATPTPEDKISLKKSASAKAEEK